MTYQVLARKWRPRNFKELVGQDHVVRALVNGLDNDRLHHAFLFTGTRGVGKTTIARIFAKSLNCEQGVSSEPCGECVTCQEINDGRFIDLIEVDAASRTKVDETRELLENVQYSPTRGRFKVYLIDEVHMFSNHSFNALLKTLEEPPPHVKFLLATTDPQKLPVTILSRCLQFNLKRLLLDQIESHLKTILSHENVEYEQPALNLIARGADGSMRDALSLLDQAIAFGGGSLPESDVRTMLGTIEQHYVTELLNGVAGGDSRALLERLGAIAEHSPDYESLLSEILVALHQIAMAQAGAENLSESVDDVESIRQLAETMLPQDVQLYYQIALQGRRDLYLAPDPRSGLEMVLLRMVAFRPVSAGERKAVAPSTQVPRRSSAPPAAIQTKPVPPPPQPVAQETSGGEWSELIVTLGLTAMSKQLAMNCQLLEKDQAVLRLSLEAGKGHLRTPSVEERLTQAIKEVLGLRLELEVGDTPIPDQETPAQTETRLQTERSQAAEEAIQRDSTVQVLQEKFNAQVVSESIRPVD